MRELEFWEYWKEHWPHASSDVKVIGGSANYQKTKMAFFAGFEAAEQSMHDDPSTAEAIVKDIHDFIIEEFFEVSRAELADFDRFLRERLSA